MSRVIGYRSPRPSAGVFLFVAPVVFVGVDVVAAQDVVAGFADDSDRGGGDHSSGRALARSTTELCDPTTSRLLLKATSDGNDEGMTHTAPSPAIAHPDPARWLWYTFGGSLGSRYKGWVLRDTTTRTRWLRQAVRGGVPRGQRRRAMAAQRR